MEAIYRQLQKQYVEAEIQINVLLNSSFTPDREQQIIVDGIMEFQRGLFVAMKLIAWDLGYQVVNPLEVES